MKTATDPRTARAIAGTLNAPLNTEQKRALIAGARKAYDKVGRQTGMTFDDWRKEQQVQACGIASLRLCTQQHYKLIQGHWDLVNGRKVDALRKFVGASNGEQDRELALAKLRHEAEKLSAPRLVGSPFDSPAAAMQYAQGILHQMKAGTLEQASAKAIWNAFYGLKRWVAKKRWYPDNREPSAAARARRPSGAVSQGSPETRQNAILVGGGVSASRCGRVSARPATRNPQTTANEMEGTP